MLSKEEILNQFDRNEEYDSYFHEDHILKAMDEYAKQEAIEFADCMALNKYRWLLSSQKWTSPKDDLLTTDQLYQQYLNSKTNAK